MFSLDQWVATPPLSALFSIFLIAGLDLLGRSFLRTLGFDVESHKDWVRWQAPMVGAMLLAIVLYPLALAGLTALGHMQSGAIACITCGLWNLLRAAAPAPLLAQRLTTCWASLRAQSGSRMLLLLILLGMFLLALGPVTSADALDYHMAVAIAVLNHSGVQVVPEWFIGRLAGNGEILNAFALSVGAEQFGSLLQYVSLLGVVGIILFANRDVHAQADTKEQAASDLIALAAFSAPILLFLISAPKPQMWPIAMTTFAFALVVHPSRRGLSRRGALVGFALVCGLLMTASQAKFNYLLGGGVVGFLVLWGMVKLRLLMASLCVGLVAAAMIVGPAVVWKSSAFHASWFESLTHPLPGHLPGTDAFIAMAKGATDQASPLPFPFLMFIPTSFGSFSTLLGFGWLVLIGLRPGRDSRLWVGIGAAVFMAIAGAILAPPSARMYLEPYYWALIVLVLQPATPNVLKGFELVKSIVRVQAVVVAVVCWLGAINLFPGALTTEWRTGVMQSAANGYQIMRWADTVLPPNAVVLNERRSMALLPREGVSYDWSGFVDITSDEARLYLDRLKSRAVSHMLLAGPVNRHMPISNCFGKVFAGPFVGHVATRNPFNKGPNYEVWIAEFDSERLPACAQDRQ